jgi:uncharacterized protein (TIGR02646 family)
MVKIDKVEPDFYKEYIESKRPESYDDIIGIKPKLRDYILNTEQSCQCAYCEMKISSDSKHSEIDHIRKREHYFNDLDFFNMLVSCRHNDSCSHYKDPNIMEQEYDKIINPSIEDPEKLLTYTIDGRIIAQDKNNEKANFTIKIFNLNSKRLIRRRRDFTEAASSYIKQIPYEDLESHANVLGGFKGLLKFIYHNLD